MPVGSMIVTTPDVRPAYTTIYEFDIEKMGLFELGEVYARSEALIAAGVLTVGMYEQLPAVISPGPVAAGRPEPFEAAGRPEGGWFAPAPYQQPSGPRFSARDQGNLLCLKFV